MNPKFKNLIFLFAFTLALGVVSTSCKKDNAKTCSDGIQNQDETGVDCGGVCGDCTYADEQLAGLITSDKTLTNDRIWVLNGKVVVQDGVTLTIDKGTIIKGAEGTGTLASALVIARGGTIMAEGTADEPIIFTSKLDNITVGETAGTNLDEADAGLWGGLVILGKAPASLKGDEESGLIEGFYANETYAYYGGTVANDNSGVVSYVSIRHGGSEVAPDNEINGLTLGGVGSGTTINNVEIVANSDDGVEFFGGTVSPTNLLTWAQQDDGLDIDQAFSGTISNSVVILGAASDHALEIDGGEGSMDAQFTLNNITLIGNTATSKGEYADYRSKAMGASNNIYAYGFKADSDVELDNNGVAQNFLNGDLSFSNWEVVDADNTIFKEKTDEDEGESIIILDPSFTDRAADWTTQVTMGSQTVGANMSDFTWTYAHAQGAF